MMMNASIVRLASFLLAVMAGSPEYSLAAAAAAETTTQQQQQQPQQSKQLRGSPQHRQRDGPRDAEYNQMLQEAKQRYYQDQLHSAEDPQQNMPQRQLANSDNGNGSEEEGGAVQSSSRSAIHAYIEDDLRNGLILVEGTYSWDAMKWVESSSNNGMSNARIAQRYAMACIFYATNGVQTPYTIKEIGSVMYPWLEKWLTNNDECSWHGVVCNSAGNVVELNLKANWVTGVFPPEVQHLASSLKVLDLEKNLVSNVGPANVWWLGELVNLEYLSLESTGFDNEGNGPPTELKKLTKLKYLSIYGTRFEGPTNDDIYSPMTNLQYLDMGAINFSGSLPTTVRSLPNLKYLYIDYCDFSKSNDFGELFNGQGFSSIIEVWTDATPVGGALPANLGSYTTLKSLSMTSCGLKGDIPSTLGNLNQLQSLWLYNNNLSGAIPPELGSISQLKRLYLHENDLTGSMPSEICVLRYGSLQTLGADCQNEVTCDPLNNKDCCTCCGPSC